MLLDAIAVFVVVVCCGFAAEGEWGLLASSSSRLARDLLLYCFNARSAQLVSSSTTIALAASSDTKHQTQTQTQTQQNAQSLSPPASPVSLPLPLGSPTGSDSASFRTPTGSPGSTGLVGLGSPFNSSPKYFTPPTRSACLHC